MIYTAEAMGLKTPESRARFFRQKPLLQMFLLSAGTSRTAHSTQTPSTSRLLVTWGPRAVYMRGTESRPRESSFLWRK